MIQYFMKQYLFLLWGITSLIFSSLFLACSDDEPGDKTPVFTIKEEYLQQDFDQKQSSLVIPVETNLAADAWVGLVCRSKRHVGFFARGKSIGTCQ